MVKRQLSDAVDREFGPGHSLPQAALLPIRMEFRQSSGSNLRNVPALTTTNIENAIGTESRA